VDRNALVVAALSATAAGAAAWALVAPLLSGERRAEKRQHALVGDAKSRRAERTAVSRRDQVAASLKELEDKQTKKRVSLETKLVRAGLDWSKKRFYLTSAGLGLALAFAALTVSGSPLLALGALFTGGFGLPQWMLIVLKKRRIGKFIEELPNAVDVIVRGIRSGLPVGDCLRIIAREAREPVRGEFRMIVESQAMGLTLAEAVGRLFDRMPVPEANFFAIVISIQSKAGGNLSEALGNLSKVLRERRKMAAKIQAMSMEAKASAGIIAALPFTVAALTWMTSPNYIELLWTTQAGKFGLVMAAFWMTLGCLVMKKMINFKF
jgi:tight adherence protein B